MSRVHWDNEEPQGPVGILFYYISWICLTLAGVMWFLYFVYAVVYAIFRFDFSKTEEVKVFLGYLADNNLIYGEVTVYLVIAGLVFGFISIIISEIEDS